MFVKARYIAPIRRDTDVEFLYVFSLDEEDQALLDRPINPDGGTKARKRDNLIPAWLFAAALPYQRDQVQQGSTEIRLEEGELYWVSISSCPFHPIRTIQAQHNLKVPQLRASGIYPILTANDLRDFPVAPEELGWLQRAVGALLMTPITNRILQAAARISWNPVNATDPHPVSSLAARMRELYRLWAACTPVPSNQNDWLQGLPIAPLVEAESNPEAFGTPGVDFLRRVIHSPYTLLGPTSAPGGTSDDADSSAGLPFWSLERIDQLVRQRTPDALTLSGARAGAIVDESFLYLERRNSQAFDATDDQRFDFELGGDADAGVLPPYPAPAGSLTFQDQVVQTAIARRVSILSRMYREPGDSVWIYKASWPNVYYAYSKLLGIPIYRLGDLHGTNNPDEPEPLVAAIRSASRPTFHPQQVVEYLNDPEAKPDHRCRTGYYDETERVINICGSWLMRATQAPFYRRPEGAIRPDMHLPVFRLDVTPPKLRSESPSERWVTPSQLRAFLMVCRWPVSAITGNPGTGKASCLDSLLLTPTGWTRMGDIQVGDLVIGQDGKPKPVLDIYPQGEQDIYRVWFSDGSSTECTDDHLWKTKARTHRKILWGSSKMVDGKRARQFLGREQRWEVRTLKEIRETLTDSQGASNHQIPMMEPAHLGNDEDLPIHPYVLGVLLGNGSFVNGSLTVSTSDTEVVDSVRELLPQQHEIYRIEAHTRGIDYRISGNDAKKNLVLAYLRTCSLWNKFSIEKFVPREYLFSSVRNRLALLQGLLDTDGHVDHYQIEYSTSSPQLAKDVRFLVESLGGTATLMVKENPTYTHQGERRTGQTTYRLYIVLPPEVEPFRLSRKSAQYTPHEKYMPHRIIRSIEYVGKKPAQCIRVGGDCLYVTDHCIVTHNTHMQQQLLRLCMQITARQGWMLVLSSTNRAAAQLAERLRPQASREDIDVTMLATVGSEDNDRRRPNLLLGTLDSFLVRFRVSNALRRRLAGRDGFIAVDEASMLTMQKVYSLLMTMQSMMQEVMDGEDVLEPARPLRLIFVGDERQLPSVEPGDFLSDMQSELPVVRLTEAVRVEGVRTGPLQFYSLMRDALTDERMRHLLAQYLMAVGVATHPIPDDRDAVLSAIRYNPAQIQAVGLEDPITQPPSWLTVRLVPDVPFDRPLDEEQFMQMATRLDIRVRDAILQETLRWFGVWQPNDDLMSSYVLTGDPKVDADARLAAYQRFMLARQALLGNTLFKIVTAFRVAQSQSGKTYYLSSAQRVNQHIVNFILGEHPIAPDARAPSVPPDPRVRVWPDEEYRRRYLAVLRRKSQELIERLQFETPSKEFYICPQWVYAVRKNQFRDRAVFRSETMLHIRSTTGVSEPQEYFLSESGMPLNIPRNYANARALSYGWAVNVHQVQGGEYPLVIVPWLDGIRLNGPGGWYSSWNDLRGGGTLAERTATAMEPYRQGIDPLDDRMDLRKLYTAVTRMKASFDIPETHRAMGLTGEGRLVIITGIYAIRRLLAQSVVPRATPALDILSRRLSPGVL